MQETRLDVVHLAWRIGLVATGLDPEIGHGLRSGRPSACRTSAAARGRARPRRDRRRSRLPPRPWACRPSGDTSATTEVQLVGDLLREVRVEVVDVAGLLERIDDRRRRGPCRRRDSSSYSKEVTTPKLPPPPRRAQKRSGFSVALARRNLPSAVITSAERRLSQVRPWMRCRRPWPPPSVSPAAPVCDTVPAVVTRPKAAALAVEVAEQRPGADECAARQRIHAHAAHGREVDHQPAVADRLAGEAVAAAAHGDEQVVGAGEVHRARDVGRAGAARDDRGTAVEHAVPDAPRACRSPHRRRAARRRAGSR